MAGFGAPPPYGAPAYPSWPAGAAAPVADRPPREYCFFIKSTFSNQVLEVQGAAVDPGTSVVTAAVKGQGQDSQLWFEDTATGAIKSRLNLLCLDLQGALPAFQLVRNTGAAPHGAVNLGRQSDSGRYFSAVANTAYGTVPGKAQGNTCWYPYAGREHVTSDFSWVVVSSSVSQLANTGAPPPGAMAVGHLTDGSGPQYAAIAKSRWGTIPGRAQGNICYFPYGNQEHATSDFTWVVGEQACLIVNTCMPGNQNQGWLRTVDRIQNRYDANKVLQVSGKHAGSSVSVWSNSGVAQQLWTFPNPSPGAHMPQPAGAVYPTIPAAAPPPVQPVMGGRRYFYLRSELHGKVLDVQGGNRSAGTMVILYPRKPAQEANQLWYMDDSGVIRSKLNDFALQPSGHGIWLQPYSNLPNTQWTVSGKQIMNKNSGNCLEVHGANQANGTKINKTKYKGQSHQHWYADYV